MKSALFKDYFRLIRFSFRRFIAITMIVMIGVAFFSGLRAAKPDMCITVDHYFDSQNAADIRMQSTLGFEQADVDALRELDGIEEVQTGYTADAFVHSDTGALLVNCLSLDLDPPDSVLNRPYITDGRLPVSSEECLVDELLGQFDGIKIGDTLVISTQNDPDISDSLSCLQYTVCGFTRSVEYIDFNRGISTKGSGQRDGYIILPSENFTTDVFTQLYVKAEDWGISRFSDRYKKQMEDLCEDIIRLGEQRNPARLERLIREATEKLTQEATLADSEKQLAKLKQPKWYTVSWNQNAGFTGFGQNADRVDAIGLVFPLIFFLVAALVSLTNMTRLVEDDRSAIGVLKALGYGRASIAYKYIIYAGLAAALGIAGGVALGSFLFPAVIYNAYGIIYSLPPVMTPVHWSGALMAAAGALASSVLPALLVCQKELFTVPALLMRPRAPKNGQRILLERIGFIWKRFNFSHKVTCRNVFRYKKRLLMTVFGIAGCTALIFTGFGLKDSISAIAPNQFEQIQKYDMLVRTYEPDEDSVDNPNGVWDILEQSDTVETSVPLYMNSCEVVANGQTLDAVTVVPMSDAVIGNFVNLRRRTSGDAIELNGQRVVITEKLMTILGLSEGDTVSILSGGQDDTTVTVTVTVSTPAENYVGHYVYMSPQLYLSLYGTEPTANSVMSRLSDTTEQPRSALSVQLMESNQVAAVTYNTEIREEYDDMIGALDIVVLVLILSAAALAFVVLFSLTGINIDERRRELATLRVLGFYNSETAMYLYRENMILTLIGIVCGLFFGYFLCMFVIVTAEIDLVMFGRQLGVRSYLLSVMLTTVFAAVVNVITIPVVNNIDMVESMKSVE